MTRDQQRSAVYAWERAIEAAFPDVSRKLPLSECGDYIARVWNDYRPGTNPPELGDGRGRSHACGSRWSIKLPVWARKPIVVLHEVAHALTPADRHGPLFARLFFELLTHYEKVPAAKIRSLAVHQKPRRVRFAEAGSAPKPVSAEWVRWNTRRKELDAALREHSAREPRREK